MRKELEDPAGSRLSGGAPADAIRAVLTQHSSTSYLGTARNHGIHPLDALRDAMAGNPWMPPQTPWAITGLNGYEPGPG